MKPPGFCSRLAEPKSQGQGPDTCIAEASLWMSALGWGAWVSAIQGRERGRALHPCPTVRSRSGSQEAPNHPQNYPQTPVWPQSHNPRHPSPNQPPPWHLQPWIPHAMPGSHLSASARAVSSAGKLGLSPFKNRPGHPSLATFCATRRCTCACFSYRQNQQRDFPCLMHR